MAARLLNHSHTHLNLEWNSASLRSFDFDSHVTFAAHIKLLSPSACGSCCCFVSAASSVWSPEQPPNFTSKLRLTIIVVVSHLLHPAALYLALDLICSFYVDDLAGAFRIMRLSLLRTGITIAFSAFYHHDDRNRAFSRWLILISRQITSAIGVWTEVTPEKLMSLCSCTPHFATCNISESCVHVVHCNTNCPWQKSNIQHKREAPHLPQSLMWRINAYKRLRCETGGRFDGEKMYCTSCGAFFVRLFLLWHWYHGSYIECTTYRNLHVL